MEEERVVGWQRDGETVDRGYEQRGEKEREWRRVVGDGGGSRARYKQQTYVILIKAP